MHAADLRRLLDAAHRGGESRAFLDRMAAQLVHLELRVADLERLVDRRRLAQSSTSALSGLATADDCRPPGHLGLCVSAGG